MNETARTQSSLVRRTIAKTGDVIVLIACVGFLAGFVLFPAAEQPPLPDFSSMETALKKRQFFSYLSPIVARVNYRFIADRERLDALMQDAERGRAPSWFDRRWLSGLAQRLEVPLDEFEFDEALAELHQRTGIIPESLVLAQAAKESGWGTSRFAVEGNNLFGQRCYQPDCGIVPRQRAAGASFGVAKFESVEDAVESYILNLNTHPNYQSFREMRYSLRQENKPLSGLSLVQGLLSYSTRGQEYISELRALIRQNGLE